MLNIFYARESVDKERFMYDRIKERGYGPESRVLVIVPDQYTVEAEKEAFRLLGVDSLMGLDVYSISHLCDAALKGRPEADRVFINKYGRQMLLTKILKEETDGLAVYGGKSGSAAFIEKMSELITQLKQYNVTPEMLRNMPGQVPGRPLLAGKLSDIAHVFEEYEKEIEGKFTDSEDRRDLAVSLLGELDILKGSSVWVYGFDTFSPKDMAALIAVMKASSDTNIVMTCDMMSANEALFDLTGSVIAMVRGAALEAGVTVGSVSQIPAVDAAGCDYRTVRPAGIRAIERGLWSVQPWTERGVPEGVILSESANIYQEAESAAAFALSLMRDHGFRLSDIEVICNDQTTRTPIIARAFEEYGIDLFVDMRRNILDSGIAVFLISLLETVRKRYRRDDIFRTLKTGFAPVPQEETEQLEDYAIKYRINGMMWKAPFEKGTFEYGEAGLAELENYRQHAMSVFLPVEKLVYGRRTNAEFIEEFRGFLEKTLRVPDLIDRAAERQRAEGLGDSADVMIQVWTAVNALFDQISEIIGDVRFDFETFVDLLKEGLKATEVGILPSSRDDMMLGTMQRTRSADVRAVLIVGANDGVLPQAAPEGDILAADEIELLADCGCDLGRVDRLRVMEERLAIYRNLVKPSDVLWISWSKAGTDGKEIHRSELIDDICEHFPDLRPRRDIFNGPADSLVGSPESTIRHLTGELSRASVKHDKLDPVWMAARDWYTGGSDGGSDKAGTAKPGAMALLGFDNKTAALPPYLADLMLSGSGRDSLSPSRLERYAGCPYRYFIEQGLRPTERRPYETSPREIGDVYHNCIMEITSRLTREGLWDTITDEQCRAIVSETVAKENESYREGLFSYGGKERYRAQRMEETCFETVRALIAQARAGNIRESYYELPFGRPRPDSGQGSGSESEPEFRLAPMEIEADGRRIYIEGRIDRLDILGNGRLKIIDYKSGNRKVDLAEMRAGYSMQLMVYMQAAENGLEGAGEPGGMFYFHIKEPRVKSPDGPGTVAKQEESPDETAGELEAEIRKQFKLSGILVDDPETIREIAGEFTGSSDIAESVTQKIDGTFSGKAVIPEPDMKALEREVRDKIGELCEGIVKGEIPIRPVRHNDVAACRYCEHRSICRFDIMYPGCEFNKI